MSYNNQLDKLGSFVERAETQRTFQNTTALQEFMDNHPQIAALTLSMTDEVKQRLVMYMGNADQKAQEKLQGELDALGRHLANLTEKPNILHQLLCEEVLVSFLMLRCSDVMYSRHHANVSTLGLRKMDTAQIRFLRALKTLASIHQKLPFINVNLGSQQIAMIR